MLYKTLVSLLESFQLYISNKRSASVIKVDVAYAYCGFKRSAGLDYKYFVT